MEIQQGRLNLHTVVVKGRMIVDLFVCTKLILIHYMMSHNYIVTVLLEYFKCLLCVNTLCGMVYVVSRFMIVSCKIKKSRPYAKNKCVIYTQELVDTVNKLPQNSSYALINLTLFYSQAVFKPGMHQPHMPETGSMCICVCVCVPVPQAMNNYSHKMKPE